MYVPALVLVVTLVLALERWLALARIGADPGAVDAVLSVLETCCDVAAGLGYATRLRGGSARIAAAGLRELAWPIDRAQAAMADARTSEVARARRRIDFLPALAGAAALSGTLGTFAAVHIALAPVACCDYCDK